MAKIVEVAVIKIGELTPSKFNDGYPYHRVITKGLRDNRTYVLNLQKKPGESNARNYMNWVKNLKPGIALKVSLQDNGSNISQYREFKLLQNNLSTKETSDIITEDTIDENIILIQIERIKRATETICNAQEIINKTIEQKRG